MTSLKVIASKCRGISNMIIFNRVKDILRSRKPNIVCLVETCANVERVNHFCCNFNQRWEWAMIPYSGFSGTIIVLWRNSICIITPLAILRRIHHLVISSHFLSAWILPIVYNGQTIEAQRNVWNEPSRLFILNFPCIIIRDFNYICSPPEYKGGSFNYYFRKYALFNLFISKNASLDMSFSGSKFTWYNGQSGSTYRWARLDRYLVNTNGTTFYNNYCISHLPRICSNNSPLLLNAWAWVHIRNNVFRF